MREETKIPNRRIRSGLFKLTTETKPHTGWPRNRHSQAGLLQLTLAQTNAPTHMAHTPTPGSLNALRLWCQTHRDLGESPVGLAVGVEGNANWPLNSALLKLLFLGFSVGLLIFKNKVLNHYLI